MYIQSLYKNLSYIRLNYFIEIYIIIIKQIILIVKYIANFYLIQF